MADSCAVRKESSLIWKEGGSRMGEAGRGRAGLAGRKERSRR